MISPWLEKKREDMQEGDFLIDDLRRMIGEHAGTEEAIQAILDELQRTDWTVYTHQPVKCVHCKRRVQRRDLRDDFRFVTTYQHFCVYCESEIRARATEVCQRCGLLFEKTGYLDDPCPDCAYLMRRQQSQKRRR